MKTIKTILALAIAFLLIGCTAEERTDCNCEKKLYLYQPPMSLPNGQHISARMDYVRSLYNQCGTTNTNPENESGADYNKFTMICE